MSVILQAFLLPDLDKYKLKVLTDSRRINNPEIHREVSSLCLLKCQWLLTWLLPLSSLVFCWGLNANIV